jgi:ectoine hydroxylase-related dioxygenase (phytanoyl-CoA dioxygenase family)
MFEYMGEEFQIDVKEGDYVVFPSMLKHCSKPNETQERKTIIALNINVLY